MTTGVPANAVVCLQPEEVEGAVLFNEAGNYTVGSVIIYTCSYTHNFIRGNLSRECLQDGLWTGDPPVCSRNDGKSEDFQIQVPSWL